MGEHVFTVLSGFFQHYGYWTIAIGLLLENAGVPLPGESILLFASFLAASRHQLYLPWVILIAIAAATLGDNTGYAVGRYGGRRLLARYRHALHISPRSLVRGERLFDRHGAVDVFLARFIAGLRIVAGPLAGTLRMKWRRFLLFNFLGAAVWVVAVALAGYFFGNRLAELVHTVGRIDLYLMIAAGIAAALLWWRHERNEGRATLMGLY